MTIKRAELLGVLKQCLPGVESGSITLEGADTVIFSGGSVYTYNDIVSVRVPVVDTGLLEEPLEGAVKATEFYNIINKLSGEEIKATTTDSSWILKCGKAKVEMALIPFDYKARLQNVDPGEEGWIDLHKDFQMGLGLCKMSANRSSLSGVIFSGEHILSTDGWQINRCVLPGAEFPLFWINDPAASEILKLIKIKQINLKTSWAHFKTEAGSVFSVKTLQADKWPVDKIEALLESHVKVEGDIGGNFPKDLFSAIDRASSFSEDIDDYETVSMTLTKKGINVHAVRAAGKYTELVPWGEKEGEGITKEITLNVSSVMMAHAAKRSMGFYIHSTEKGGKAVDRLVFIGEYSQHLLSTFSQKET